MVMVGRYMGVFVVVVVEDHQASVVLVDALIKRDDDNKQRW